MEHAGTPFEYETPGAGAPAERRRRWDELAERVTALGEDVASEWSAAYQALKGPGTGPTRKWLGWALYRLAARVNPEIRD